MHAYIHKTLTEELGDIKLHAVGLCETNKRREGLSELSGVRGCMKYEKRRNTQKQKDWHS